VQQATNKLKSTWHKTKTLFIDSLKNTQQKLHLQQKTMATLIDMTCIDCGFTSGEVTFGPTFDEFRTMGPALDTNTNEIVSVDYDTRQPKHIVLYKSPRLRRKQQGHNVFATESGTHKLQADGNFCPSCNGFTLRIEVIAMVD
jgi:hypothetical protein